MHAPTGRWLLLLLVPVGVCAALPMMRSATHANTATVQRQTTAEPALAPPEPMTVRGEPAPVRREEPTPTAAPRDELAQLEATDLRAAPDEAAAAIHDLAARGRAGSARDRDEAARTLARWLREETRREAADARGNVPNLIEALGALGGDLSVSALVDALEDERHDLSLKTLIVQQLGALGDARALRAVDRFTLVAENTAVRDDFDAELRDEALAAADESGRRLRH